MSAEKVFSFLKSKKEWILYLILSSLVLFLYFRDKHYPVRIVENRALVEALTDSVRILTNLHHELYYEKAALTFSLDDIKQLNLRLSEEVRKYKNDIHAALVTRAEVVDTFKDTVFIPFPSLPHSLAAHSFQLKDSVIDLSFRAALTDSLVALSDFRYSLTLPLFAAFAYDSKKRTNTVILSSLPNVRFTHTQGFTQPLPPPKRFGLGLHVGYGASFTPGIKFYPTVSVGLNYNFFNL